MGCPCRGMPLPRDARALSELPQPCSLPPGEGWRPPTHLSHQHLNNEPATEGTCSKPRATSCKAPSYLQQQPPHPTHTHKAPASATHPVPGRRGAAHRQPPKAPASLTPCPGSSCATASPRPAACSQLTHPSPPPLFLAPDPSLLLPCLIPLPAGQAQAPALAAGGAVPTAGDAARAAGAARGSDPARQVGAGSPAAWALLAFGGSWDPPPPVARQRVALAHRFPQELRWPGKLNPPTSAPPCARLPAAAAAQTLPGRAWGGRAAPAKQRLSGASGSQTLRRHPPGCGEAPRDARLTQKATTLPRSSRCPVGSGAGVAQGCPGTPRRRASQTWVRGGHKHDVSAPGPLPASGRYRGV